VPGECTDGDLGSPSRPDLRRAFLLRSNVGLNETGVQANGDDWDRWLVCSLYSILQASIRRLASLIASNQWTFKHSSRNDPLNVSM
jgi:hypothetical protein